MDYYDFAADDDLYEDTFDMWDGWLAARAFMLEPVEDQEDDDDVPDIDWDPLPFFHDGLDDADVVVPPKRSSFGPSAYARPRNKEFTLRSWRNPRSCGGWHSRKAVARKMDLRRPVKGLVVVELDGPSGFYMRG